MDWMQKIARWEFKKDPDNGMLIGPDGCHYETEAHAFYFAQFGLCGCGRPEDVHAFLLNCMSASRDDYPNLIDVKKVQNLVEEAPEVVAEFVMHFLDKCAVTEHGSSVNGSWLTDRGRQVLEAGPMEDKE
ncbi:MAG: hypothetical protein VX464_20730 [Pseudomonadota bacterium]|nr:hypothetical protein [Pseudomonadota bacterium]